ncbi:MAG: tagaturonate reductase [Blautia sp.]
MEKLSYQILKEQNYKGYLLREAPERVLQFGEGNFMRAFTDHFIDMLNEKTGFNGKAVLVQPRPKRPGHKLADDLNTRNFCLISRGFVGKRSVTSVSSPVSAAAEMPYEIDAEVMACAENLDLPSPATPRAGIVYDPACRFQDRPASSFPGKLTQFLYRRYEIFGSEKGKGFVILPCELIAENGKELKKCVLSYAAQWDLEEGFPTWLEEENMFCSTLVDLIVTGFPKGEEDALNEENGYLDAAMDTGEVFAFWVIEGPAALKQELPFEKAGLPVLITDDHKPYKERKVRILNGAHTSMVMGAYLAGFDIVRDCMEDDHKLLPSKAVHEEIIPTLSLPKEELESFASAVTERFKNPFIDHALLSICLNSTSKWKARVLPSLKAYMDRTGKLPLCLTASFAFYLAFYRGKELTDAGLAAVRPDGGAYTVSDDRNVLSFFAAHKDDTTEEYVHAVCGNEALWDMDLCSMPGFEAAVTDMLNKIQRDGAYEMMKSVC